MSDQSWEEFVSIRGRKCVCGAYHVKHPHLLAIHEYDRATPERQQEMLREIAQQDDDGAGEVV